MGEFLSTPIKDKITHDDENSFVNTTFYKNIVHNYPIILSKNY